MKTVTLSGAQPELTKLFDEVQAGSPVLLVRGNDVLKVERVDPREYGGDIATLENMLLEAVEGPHSEWTPKDIKDIAKRVRSRNAE